MDGKKYLTVKKKDWMLISVETIILVVGLDFVFYRNLWALIPLSGIGFLFFRMQYAEHKEKLRQRTQMEFKELLMLTQTGLRAGNSVENALENSYGDLKKIVDSDSAVLKLLKNIIIARRNNNPIAKVFIEAGKVMKIPDITEFGYVFEISYERSGNMTQVMEKCVLSIVDKLDTRKKINDSLNERRFEMRIMSIMPFGIMGYIGLTNKGYFAGMYNNSTGIVIMSACLIVYICAYIWSERIVRIKV